MSKQVFILGNDLRQIIVELNARFGPGFNIIEDRDQIGREFFRCQRSFSESDHPERVVKMEIIILYVEGFDHFVYQGARISLETDLNVTADPDDEEHRLMAELDPGIEAIRQIKEALLRWLETHRVSEDRSQVH